MNSRAESSAFDATAKTLEAQFREPDNERLMRWLPRYLESTAIVEQSLRSGETARAFDHVWLMQDNFVAFAGRGLLRRDVVERLRGELTQMLLEIWRDGSPGQFAQLQERLSEWAASKRISKVPRMLLARAFATVHPERYHTTVSQSKHEAVIPWFERHTGFVAPPGDWAVRAAALTHHLEQSRLFSGQRARRNMFPWHVFESLGATPSTIDFRPEHVSKVRRGQSISPTERRDVTYRQNVIQDRLVEQLRRIYGHDAVGSEQPTGTGGRADVLVRLPEDLWAIYEIKPAETARQAVREALGQLLEYGYRTGARPDVTLHIVSDADLDSDTELYLERLSDRFDLHIEYLHVGSAPDGGEEAVSAVRSAL
ncbi:MAG: hypothetical protein O9256_00865 [Rhizobiaceae bacterium]|nr:hypothetical protein [Rhizobiaceae bacterium]